MSGREKLTPEEKQEQRLAEAPATTTAQETIVKDRLLTVESLIDDKHPYHKTPHRPLPDGQATKLVGRMAWWRKNPEKLNKLEMAFVMGATDLQACFLAGISDDQLYYYQKLHPEFSERKRMLKDVPTFIAMETVIRSLKNNVGDAWQYLERKAPDEWGAKNVNVNANIDVNEMAAARNRIHEVHEMVKATGVVVEEVTSEGVRENDNEKEIKKYLEDQYLLSDFGGDTSHYDKYLEMAEGTLHYKLFTLRLALLDLGKALIDSIATYDWEDDECVRWFSVRPLDLFDLFYIQIEPEHARGRRVSFFIVMGIPFRKK